MNKIITLAGSNSKKSINKQLAEYTASLMQDVEVLNLDLNDYQLPLFSIDVENDHGFPADLLVLDKIIENTDGIILALPTMIFSTIVFYTQGISHDILHGCGRALSNTLGSNFNVIFGK